MSLTGSEEAEYLLLREIEELEGALWQPFPGPQAAAFASVADHIGYGGAGGGGKSDFILGLAGTKHKKSIIFRRVFPSLRAMINRSREIYNQGGDDRARDSFNEQLHLWRLGDGKMIEFGSVQHEKDLKKYQGQPHDLIAIDEATEIPESYVRFLMGWNRTSDPNQQCQVVLTFNPPMDDEGEWVIGFFAPWLDETYPDPALDGEIRYVGRVDDQDVFFRSPADAPAGIRKHLKKRTFFHAFLSDNPVYLASGYESTIEAMPEPIRSAMKGDFSAAKTVDPFQVCPTLWVRAAQMRWEIQEAERREILAAGGKVDNQLIALGADVARGGADKTARAPLYRDRIGIIETCGGRDTDSGPKAAAFVKQGWDGKAPIAVDIVGVGGSPVDFLRAEGISVEAFNPSAGTDAKDKSGLWGFVNARAESYWLVREAIDPDGDIKLALPPDPELLGDLCAPRWKPQIGKIAIHAKDDIKKRLKRSPDKGDAVAIAVWAARAPTKKVKRKTNYSIDFI